ncbi:hypothetical protein K402DRAFT_335921 [Aulographum hederae CBS 113979]|uniref:U1-type domain-containing protein n=1 Tax=Aulographum hederae CBS 113979 TaxID=1176131 RepID=A0A6G1GV31_9PEZI|nr:hypothetical protein K402DRAFT_335921 [Aulographum hederae CBS 113979]
MSEYWKSTPKYWCKFCKTHVKDTPVEKKNHEATPKHQGNIQRSLRDLHRTQEREEREKQRAKDEVARLKGTASSASPGPGVGASAPKELQWNKTPTFAAPQPKGPVSLDERKRQMQQLADMGVAVAVPEQFRPEMAMAGEWHVVSQKPVYSKREENMEDVKPEARAMGVRKRKAPDDDEEDAHTILKKKGWGATYKSYPGAKGTADGEDLDALFAGGMAAAPIKMEEDVKTEADVKEEEDDDGYTVPNPTETTQVPATDPVAVKTEEDIKTETLAKIEPAEPDPKVLFKRRKNKKG